MTVRSGENLGRKAEIPSNHISDSVIFWLLFQLPMTYFTMMIIYATLVIARNGVTRQSPILERDKDCL